MEKVICTDNTEISKFCNSDLTLNKEYIILGDDGGLYYKIENDKGKENWFNKNRFKKSKTWTQEAIEHAEKEMENNIKKIFDESIKNIGEDKAGKPPINYEEEYYKLKNQNTEYFIQWGEAESKAKKQEREIEELKEENKLVKDQLENELNRNRVLKEKLEEKPTIINNYEDEINKLRCQYEEVKEVANNFEIVADKYRAKQETMESDLIKYESIIKNQKEAIKALAKLL